MVQNRQGYITAEAVSRKNQGIIDNDTNYYIDPNAEF